MVGLIIALSRPACSRRLTLSSGPVCSVCFLTLTWSASSVEPLLRINCVWKVVDATPLYMVSGLPFLSIVTVPADTRAHLLLLLPWKRTTLSFVVPCLTKQARGTEHGISPTRDGQRACGDGCIIYFYLSRTHPIRPSYVLSIGADRCSSRQVLQFCFLSPPRDDDIGKQHVSMACIPPCPRFLIALAKMTMTTLIERTAQVPLNLNTNPFHHRAPEARTRRRVPLCRHYSSFDTTRDASRCA